MAQATESTRRRPVVASRAISNHVPSIAILAMRSSQIELRFLVIQTAPHLVRQIVFGEERTMSGISQRVAVWQRTERAGLFATIAWFVGAAIFLNAIIFSFGVDRNAGALDRISWAPPGWAIGAIWVLLFSLYAVSHWLLLQRGESGQRAARWVLAIAAWDLSYPLLTNGFDLQIGAWLNVVTACFTILLLWRVWRDSRIAFACLLPSLIWVCFATVLTFVAVQEMK